MVKKTTNIDDLSDFDPVLEFEISLNQLNK
jgi:hypothetical protein